jgi:hypothetical protein
MLVVGHLVTIRRLDVIAIAIARHLQDFAEHEVGLLFSWIAAVLSTRFPAAMIGVYRLLCEIRSSDPR